MHPTLNVLMQVGTLKEIESREHEYIIYNNFFVSFNTYTSHTHNEVSQV